MPHARANLRGLILNGSRQLPPMSNNSVYPSSWMWAREALKTSSTTGTTITTTHWPPLTPLSAPGWKTSGNW